MLDRNYTPGVQKKRTSKYKKRVFFTKSYCQGMKVIVFVKSHRPKGPRPVEMMFGGTVLPNNALSGGTVPPNSTLFGRTPYSEKWYLIQ